MPSPLDSRRIANVVIAKNLNHASPEVQVQALEASNDSLKRCRPNG